MRRLQWLTMVVMAGTLVLAGCDFEVEKPKPQSCSSDADCSAGYCNPVDGVCQTCVVDDHCPTGKVCHPDSHQCVACVDDSDCALGVCDPETNFCIECQIDADCPSEHCDEVNHICIECGADDECDDGNVCTIDTCEEGKCVSSTAGPGTVCDDGDPCTLNDFCVDGSCMPGRALDPDCVEPPDPCKDQPDGTPCDDEDPCTLDEICLGGQCTPDSYDPSCAGEDLDGDGFTKGEGDCNDKDASVFPGAPELCNGKDDNCDGKVDEGCMTECIITGCSGEICAAEPMDSDCQWLPEYDCLEFTDCGHFAEDGSCGWELNDEYLACLAGVCTPKEEICDGKDNDCDGLVDEGGVCGGCVSDDQCDDGDPCTADECVNGECQNLGVPGCMPDCGHACDCYEIYGNDFPEPCDLMCINCGNFWSCVDGFCQAECGQIPDEVLECTCQPTPEVCDGQDNDCDGLVDEGNVCGSCVKEGEGYEGEEVLCCPGLTPVPACEETPADCDLSDPDCLGFGCECPNCLCFICTHCGNGICGQGENQCNCPEDCSGPVQCTTDSDCLVDNPCMLGMCMNGVCVFEPDPNCGPDEDGDGYPVPEDCDDKNPDVHPGAPEFCDGLDNDCDGLVDEDCIANCWDDAMCPAGYFCKYPDGECDNAKSGDCVQIPLGCYDLWAPVCGCNGVTYANDCDMEAAGQSMAYEGECENECIPEGGGYMGANGQDNQCCGDLVPVFDCVYEESCYTNDAGEVICEMVCGCPDCYCFVCTACGDGICGVGENPCNCEQDCNGEPPMPCATDSDCDDGDPTTLDFCKEGICVYQPVAQNCGGFIGLPCPDGQYCQYPEGTCDWADMMGTCVDVPELQQCSWLWEPVCGCDGETYANPCLMEAAMMSMAYKGQCENGGQTCQVVEPGSHGVCAMVLGVIFDGQACVMESGCSCAPDCEAFFPTMEACHDACL